MRALASLFASVLALSLGIVPSAAALPGQVAAPLLNTGAVIESDFEDGTAQGWTVRETEGGGTQLEVVTIESLDHLAPAQIVENHPAGVTNAIAITGRDNQGDGAIIDVRDRLVGGEKYEFSAYALFLDGDRGALTLSSQTDGNTFTNLIEFPSVSFGEWTHISGTFTMPLFTDVANLYVETPWEGGLAGNTDSFALANIVISAPDLASGLADLPALKDTMPGMNTGMAIDTRETTGPASALLLQQFNQVVAENHMKPEAWFDGQWNFERIGEGSQNMRLHPQARAILEFAAEHNLDVFGHVLIWHSQIPDWFFQDANGNWLSGEEGRAELLRRMDNYIYNVAKLITDEFGPFGSPTNPMTAWEVANEVVANSAFDLAGLRNSRWMQIIGEDFVDQAFIKADQYVNHEFAAPGTDRPISLWINDYNTEVADKRQRYLALVTGMLERGVPIDGVGQQFHVQMATPVASIRQALDDFGPLPVRQGVTEFDITMANANFGPDQLEAQGHRVMEIFNAFREHQAAFNDLDFVTVWGLTDARSWRSDLAPVLFFGNLEPKPAFWGAIGDMAALGALRGEAVAFGGGFTAAWAGANADTVWDDPAWRNLPPQELTDATGDFQVRRNDAGVVILANAVAAADTLQVLYDGKVINVDLGGIHSEESDIHSAMVRTNDDGTHQAIVFIPDATEKATAELDVRVSASGTDLGGWNSPGNFGTIHFVEPLSFTQSVEADRAPVFGVEADPIWDSGVAIRTDYTQSGAADGATAIVHTLWHDDTLYIRFDVTDPTIDVSASDAWEQDSVEVFLDLGNAKNGEYRPWHDIQVRVNADGVVTFGAGETGRMEQRLTATEAHRTDTGYVVELAIGLWTINEHQSRVDYGGVNTFQGFDVQVNDATGGARTSVHSWANPTDQGFQDTSRWGVIELVHEAGTPGHTDGPTVVAPIRAENNILTWIPFLVGIPALGLLAWRWLATRRRRSLDAEAADEILAESAIQPESEIEIEE